MNPWDNDPVVQGNTPWANDPVMGAQKPQQTSQALGFEQGIGHFLSNMAGAGDYAGRKLGLPMDSIERTLYDGKTLQQAQDMIANPAHPANVAPGMFGKVGANILSTLPAAVLTGPFVGGALSGAMLTNEKAPLGILKDAGIGGATGWATGKLFSGIGNALPKKVASVPTTDELRQSARQAYDTADQSGMIIAGPSVNQLSSKIENDLANEGFDATLHPGTARALARIQQAADPSNPAGGNITLQGLDILRKVAGKVGSSNVMNKADAHMSGIIRNNLDDFVNGLGPQDVVGGQLDKNAVNALGQARQLWRTSSKSQMVDDLLGKAETQAEVNYTQAGLDQAIRRNFANVLTNPKKLAQFTPDEQAAIKKIAAGGPIGNALRQLGKFAPKGVVSAGMDTVIGGKFGTIPLMIAGGLSKLGANAATEQNANMLSSIVRNGGTVPLQTPGMFGKALMYSAPHAARLAPPLLFSSGIVPVN